MFLVVYVDDFKLAGPEGSLAKGWELVRQSGLKIEDPTPPGFFLGCLHEGFEAEVNGRKVRGFKYNMESYLRDTVVKYVEMVKKQTGKSVNLQVKKQAPTPFLPEDQKAAPSGRPLSDSKARTCPYCMKYKDHRRKTKRTG